MWRLTPVILALGRLRQKDGYKLHASLSSVRDPVFKK